MRLSILLVALVLAACGNDDPPARAKPAPAAEVEEPELTARDVDRELDEIEREINDEKSDQRELSQR